MHKGDGRGDKEKLEVIVRSWSNDTISTSNNRHKLMSIVIPKLTEDQGPQRHRHDNWRRFRNKIAESLETPHLECE